MNKIIIFNNKLPINISNEDWQFLCSKVFYNDNPTIEEIEMEFVTGTGITPKKKELWKDASIRFAECINDLRTVKSLDLNAMCRKKTKEQENEI